MRNRIKNIFKNIKKETDAIIIKNSTLPYIDDNFFYTTDLEKGLFENSLAILYPNNTIDLVIPELEAETAKKVDAEIYVYKGKEEIKDITKTILTNVKTIGLNYKALSHKDFQNFKQTFTQTKFIDVSEGFTKTRLIKDQQEIELIKQSCKIADAAMKKIPDLLSEGQSENEIAAEIDYFMQKKGADKSAFETISSFGKNAAEPHYSHGNVKLKKNDFAIFDFGACYKKYNSDITRTFVCGKADQKQKNMHETVLNAQITGFDAITPGVKASAVHEKVSSYINKTRFKDCFIHSTGHSLGLGVHDGPGFSFDSELIVEENMVFTVEPGVYISGFGGVRIEDDILVKKDGVELLTKSSRELIEV